jgi:ABC-type multidrug transport system permease subunit
MDTASQNAPAVPTVPPLLHSGLSLRAELRILGGFFQRRMAEFFSNRTNSIFGLLQILCAAVVFGLIGSFITKYTSPDMVAMLQGCPDYTSFLITAHLVQIMIWSAQGNVTWLVRSREFPNLYMAPCRLPTIVIGANMWKYTWIIMELVALMLISGLLFGVQFHLNAGFVVVVLGGILLMTAFDMLGAGFKIITKSDADPINWTLGISGAVLSGQFFPVQALGWAEPLSRLHPQYYINTLARRTVGQGLGLSEVWPEMQGFLITSVAFLLLSWWVFRIGFNRARVEGTLGHQ